MCPIAGKQAMMHCNYDIVCMGVKIFLLCWIVFVPIVVTARLEKIIKLLQEKK